MINVRTVLKGVFGRFLPTCVFLMSVGLAPVMLSGVEMSPWAPMLMLIQATSAALGYGGVLMALRRRLSADAPVAGRPSVTAGVVAPLVIMFSLMQGPSPGTTLGMIALPAIGGGLLALAMFFAWLAKPAQAAPELEVSEQGQLALSEAPFEAGSRPQSREPVRRDKEFLQ